MRFEWDSRKDHSNRAKHGVGFTLAAQIFDDPLLQSVPDRAIDGEERWNSTGMTPKGNVLFVVHTAQYGEFEETIRIISARKATRHERKIYEEGS